jgi:hypothetical protein
LHDISTILQVHGIDTFLSAICLGSLIAALAVAGLRRLY